MYAKETTNKIYENTEVGIIESYKSEVKRQSLLRQELPIITAVISVVVTRAMGTLIKDIQNMIKNMGGEIKGPKNKNRL